MPTAALPCNGLIGRPRHPYWLGWCSGSSSKDVCEDFPSSIGIDSIYRSKGKIPEMVLRGAGVPEDFIIYMRSLAADPIEFYSCFISYSRINDKWRVTSDKLKPEVRSYNQ